MVSLFGRTVFAKKLIFDPSTTLVFINELEDESRVQIEEQDHVVIDQCQSTLQMRRHGVVGLQQGPPELAWAARSECILQERRGSTHKQQYVYDMKSKTPGRTGHAHIPRGASSSSLIASKIEKADRCKCRGWTGGRARAHNYWAVLHVLHAVKELKRLISPEFRRFRLFFPRGSGVFS